MRYVFNISAAALLFTSLAAADEPLAVRGQSTYDKQVLPVLQQFCYDCHSDGTRKGKFALDEHKTYAELRADLNHWDHVRQMLVTHVMPPVGKDAPALPERDALVKWIDDNIFWWPADQPDPGHVVLRRLNRTEYDNTIRDVFFLYDLHPSNEFPPDDTGYGFDNIGAVLSVSQMLMEKYMAAGRKIADAALKVTPPPRASIQLAASDFDSKSKDISRVDDNGVVWFGNNAVTRTSFRVPSEGNYSITLRVAGTHAGNELPKAQIKVDGKELSTAEVKALWRIDAQRTEWQKLEVETALKYGEHTLTVAFINDFFDPAAPIDNRDRNLALAEAHVDGPFRLTSPSTGKFISWLNPKLSLGMPSMTISGDDFLSGVGVADLDNGAIYLATDGYVRHPLEISEAGKYRFTLKAGAQQAGSDPAKWEVRIGDKVVQAGTVTAKDQAPQLFKFDLDLTAGRHDLRVAFTNDFYDEKAKADRNLGVHELIVEGPVKNRDELDAGDLPGLIAKLGDKLFRRPMTEAEKAKWNALAAQAIKEGEPALGALSYVTEGMLSSPAFLFHGQPKPAGSKLGKTELIDEVTLASRLSYFLWAAPPDERLLDLAVKNELRKNLDAEVRRMIADWRGASLAENFAGQWLLLRDTDLVTPNQRVFPEFTGSLLGDMRRETEALFAHILHENTDVIEFLNADYTFVSKRLAKYYNLPGADKISTKNKTELTKVSLAGTPRGGLLTQGSILAVTSNPTRTNIVRRGKFILENILGIPPPPAPGGVPPLDEKKAIFGNQTLRQQFEQHRKDQSCAGCHALLDPMGFAMENYDAIGRFREADHRQPVDATGQLIRGQQFKDLRELREILVRDNSADFTRCLCENLLTYALGRGLEYSDRPAIRDLTDKAMASGRKFQDIIVNVCQSVPFQRMRVE